VANYFGFFPALPTVTIYNITKLMLINTQYVFTE